MKKTSQIHILVGILIASLNLFAVNDLSVREDVSHPRVGPGYIDEATLVVEPYGAYSAQSLYIKYSDHGQFPGKNCLVTHKFDLPEGAVVNDLWLWIGDSVMQALILERKHAQGIWDTITSFKRDPAFLTKTNNQYELKVYPLESGSFRKIKINYIVPNKFLNKTPYIDCSYKYLASDNNSITPLKMLFRTLEDCWGTPKIVEDPTLGISGTVDTLGKKYSKILIPDLKKLGNLTLTYDVFFTEGATYSLGKTDSNVYFSFGMYEMDYFKVPSLNQGIKKSFIGIDLSGFYGINPEEFKSNATLFLSSYLQEADTVKIVIAGEGLYDTIPSQGWYVVDQNTLTSIVELLQNSRVVKAKETVTKPRILLTDGGDGGELYFQGVEQLAEVQTLESLMGALPVINNFNIASSYWHGLSGHTVSPEQCNTIKNTLDTFFANGGTFILFFAYNRDENNIARKYFQGLQTPPRLQQSTLQHNPDAPIGRGFPKSFRYNNCAPLINSDPEVVVDLYDEQGRPVVISKVIGKGRFILSSLWHNQDNAGLKKELCTTLLNLQNQSTHKQLKDVLSNMVSTFGQESYTDAVLMSNSDFSITSDNMQAQLQPVLLNSVYELPPVKSINLLSGASYIPPIHNIDNASYYGSSYCLKHISDQTGGMFMSRHIDSWNSITTIFSLGTPVVHELFTMNVFADGNPVQEEIFKIFPDQNYDKADFYTGKTPLAETIKIDFSVKYKHHDSVFTKSTLLQAGTIQSTKDAALKTMYENEVLKKLILQTPLDTQAVVAYAITHRVLCDFTAFLALEPNDTISFMIDPEDENNIDPTEIIVKEKNASRNFFNFCLMLENKQITLKIRTGLEGQIMLKIFNVLGRNVYTKTFKTIANHTHNFKCSNLNLGKGVYVAVAKFIPENSKNKKDVIRKIDKFTIVK